MCATEPRQTCRKRSGFTSPVHRTDLNILLCLLEHGTSANLKSISLKSSRTKILPFLEGLSPTLARTLRSVSSEQSTELTTHASSYFKATIENRLILKYLAIVKNLCEF